MRIIASRFKRTSFRVGVAACLAFAFAAANAQSFNVDVEIPNGDPIVGGGAPGSSFGAAANQTGFWNALPAVTISGFGLLDLQGNPTSVTASCVGSGGAFGFNNPGNTGDFNLLLNDADRIGTGSLRYTLSGLANGSYRIFTYSVRPNVTTGSSDITVIGAAIPTVHVAGVMPGNSFILGVTHAIHEVNITDGTLQIRADGTPGDYVNGFQIVSVPEPTPGIVLTALLVLVWLPLKSRR
jgi:hypothetical protein